MSQHICLWTRRLHAVFHFSRLSALLVPSTVFQYKFPSKKTHENGKNWQIKDFSDVNCMKVRPALKSDRDPIIPHISITLSLGIQAFWWEIFKCHLDIFELFTCKQNTWQTTSIVNDSAYNYDIKCNFFYLSDFKYPLNKLSFLWLTYLPQQVCACCASSEKLKWFIRSTWYASAYIRSQQTRADLSSFA